MTTDHTTIRLSSEQQEAINLCCDMSITIASVTGQAGTGKTTIIEEVVKRLSDEYPEKMVQLTAPTGRAAKRIEEATGLQALTCHRALRFSMPEDDEDKGLPSYSRQNKAPYDIILVDEASMVTTELRRALIDAMRKGCIIRWFGDINQLPPVDSPENLKDGSPFGKDLRKYPSVTLTHNYRSDDGIVSASARVIKNQMVIPNDKVRVHNAKRGEGQTTLYSIVKDIDFTSMDNQIICPTKRTVHGTFPINRYIQSKYNSEREAITVYIPNPHEGTVENRLFKRGDKILWTKNDYDLDLMNGTIGRVIDFDEDTGSITCDFDTRDIQIPSQIQKLNPVTGETYSYDPRRNMELAYAITTHASQGSQFNSVLFVLSNSRANVRQNIYTAITRTKFDLSILNISGALSKGIMNEARV